MKKSSVVSLLCVGFTLGVLATTAGAAMRGSAVFSDVPKGAFYDDAVGEMYGLGIIKGYDGTNKFGPNDTVTRGQVAVMMQRLRNELTGKVTTSSSSSHTTSSSSSSSSSFSQQSSNPRGLFRFTSPTFAVDENTATATITVIRSSGADEDVKVDYAVTAGTATAESDFEITSGTLNFKDGDTSKTFQITIKDDQSGEGSETVNIALSNPTGGSGLGSPTTAVLTIRDNESGSNSSSSGGGTANSSSSNSKGILTFSAVEYQVAEDGTTATITVERAGTSGEVGVSYATSNGTATGNDYSSANGTLTFGGGESTKTFTVNIADNDAVGGNKTFNLTLSSPTGGASLGTQKTAKVTIVDDEIGTYGSGSFILGDDEMNVLETDASVQVLIKRIGGSQGEKKVDYTTANGLAQAGFDYTSTSGTLTFRNGESWKYVTIPLLSDSANDPNENLFFRITGKDGSQVGSPAETIIYLQ